jgi:Skp family chaperone for outer membrane proteins
MKTPILLLLFLFFTANLEAQQKYGSINRDSLLHLIPGYKEANDALQQKRANIAIDRQGYAKRLAEKKQEYDSLKGKGSALIDTLRSYQIRDMQAMLVNFDAFTLDYVKFDTLRLAAFHYELSEAYRSACAKKKCSPDSIPHSAYSIKVNLNKEVARLLNANKFHSDPKRIGYVNKDSLLRLIPEYRGIKERNEKAMARLFYTSGDDLFYVSFENRTGDDPATQIIVDSLHHADSVACAPYEEKFRRAWEAEMKVRKVFYIYHSYDAKKVWTDPKVQFVDMNKEFAKRLSH